MSSRIPLAPGTIVGRYVILGLAGEGGMGDIYKAMDTSLERTVALKRVRSGIPGDATQERFRREALALAQLNHPGICQVFELSETDRGTFIAMEWVEGRTLAEVLHPDPLPWRQAAALLREVADALAAAHAKGLVHRDLKPSNIMVTPEGHAKVLDFGLVRFAGSADEPPSTVILPEPLPEDAETAPGEPRPGGPLSGSGSGRSLTRIGSFMGTLGYTSPEQALARPVGPPSDIFSLGILAHEMVAGERPFPGEGRAALDSVVDNQRDPLNRDHGSKAYRALVNRMLSPKPKHRPTAEQVAAELARMLKPLSALAWSGLSAAAVLLIGGTGFWLYSRGVIAGLVKGRPARVAVMGFKNNTGVPSLTAQTELGLADLVASRLRLEPKLQILDADAIAQAARALKLEPAAAAPEDQLRLAKALGADLLVTGEVDRPEGKDRLRFALRDTRGRIRAQGEGEAKQLSSTMLDAIPLAQTAARVLQKAVDPLGKDARPEPYTITPEAFTAYAEGMEAFRHGRFKEAEPLLKQAAYAVPEWPEAVIEYGATLTALAKPEMEATANWALVAARKAGSTQAEATIIRLLASQSLFRRNFTGAEIYFKQALLNAETHGDQQSRIFCMNGLGRVAESQGHTNEAIERYGEALKATDLNGDLITRGYVLTNLGNLALAQGDLQTAAQRYQSVVDTARAAGSEANEALGLNNLGIVLISQFKTQEARAALEHSFALREKNGDAYGVVSALRNLGINALTEGKDQEAHDWFRRSFDQATTISFTYGQGQAEFYLAEGDRRAGNLVAALKEYRTALAHSQLAKDHEKSGPELAGEAECLLRLHKRQDGEAALSKVAVLVPDHPCLLRAQAWSAFLRDDRARAFHLLDLAIQDPKHDAPELRPELEDLRSRFALP